ncbi:helix-turn-helix domain-containing protein [Roseinatronobacter sp.]|uniref:helix-turn-helix domain-containing protein n=1 Tax=Roseinatronobacter sp. TaxID=1945755 RepID=UPI0025FEB51D|nr:helix-turn-helix domain-containing protein [Roseibaca sp.]
MNWFGSKPKAAPVDDVQPTGFDDFEVRLGDIIRGERATMGKSLLDVQRELHIRATYIAAIEAGDLSAFEAPSFVAGYVRSYARYLGLDPDWCYRQFCAETNFAINSDLDRSQPNKARPEPVMVGELSQGLLSRTRLADDPDPFWRRLDIGAVGSVAVVLALVVGLGYGGWTVLKEVQRVQLAPADQPPEVMADLDPIATGAAQRAAGDVSLSAMQGRDDSNILATERDTAQGVVRTYRPEALEAPIMVARDGPIGAIRPEPVAEPESDDIGSAIEMALNEATLPAPEVQVRSTGLPQVEVLAVRPSWIRVRAADGTVLFEKVLDAGERYAVPQAEQAATLRAGNSGSVYLLVDGQPFGPTAPGAQVVDSIALTPSAVVESFATADLSGDQDLRSFVNVAEVQP